MAVVSIPATDPETVRESFAVAGVRQFGDPVLRRMAKPLILPAERPLATEVFLCLAATIAAARRLHNFSRGIGLAAPQIGISRRVAIVHPRGGRAIKMVNPTIVATSSQEELKFEGCLSFFDYRGEVRRPTSVTVNYEGAQGRHYTRRLDGDAARLVMHEIDHLDGRLYIDRMGPDSRLIEGGSEHP